MKTANRKRGRPPLYDWDRLFALPRFTLRKGVHYHHSVIGMAGQIRQVASRRGLSVHLDEADGVITVIVKGANHANGK